MVFCRHTGRARVRARITEAHTESIYFSIRSNCARARVCKRKHLYSKDNAPSNPFERKQHMRQHICQSRVETTRQQQPATLPGSDGNDHAATDRRRRCAAQNAAAAAVPHENYENINMCALSRFLMYHVPLACPQYWPKNNTNLCVIVYLVRCAWQFCHNAPSFFFLCMWHCAFCANFANFAWTIEN